MSAARSKGKGTKDSNPRQSHEPGGPLKPMTRADRVEVCMEMMRANEWKRGKSGAMLALQWGCARTTLEDIAAEAWRRVQAEVTDKPRIQVYALARLEKIAEDSLVAAEMSDKPGMERRVAVAALDSLLKFASGSDGMGPSWEKLSDDERWAKVDEAKARIAAVEATLPPRKALTP
jgi:hypothetical protein